MSKNFKVYRVEHCNSEASHKHHIYDKLPTTSQWWTGYSFWCRGNLSTNEFSVKTLTVGNSAVPSIFIVSIKNSCGNCFDIIHTAQNALWNDIECVVCEYYNCAACHASEDATLEANCPACKEIII